MVDDSHATGVREPVVEAQPSTTAWWVRFDIITSTLGKALGGAAGGS